MKKYFILLLTLLPICLVSCGTNTYSLTVEGDKTVLVEKFKNYYEAKETIKFKTYIIYDADLLVYLNGEKLIQTDYDSKYWTYSFKMPEKNSTIEFIIS